jgi:uncharacterized membrane protein YfcA
MVLLVGILVGFALGLTGAGGSIVAVPLLMFVLDMRPQDAMGTSLGAVSAAAMVGALIRRKAGSGPDWKVALSLAITGMCAAPVGRWLSHQVDEKLVLLLFTVLASYLAVRMWQGAEDAPATDQDASPATSVSVGMLSLAGIGVGLLAGFFGVGGGFLIVPLLNLYAGLRMDRAISTSLLVIALVGSSGYVYHVLTTASGDTGMLTWLAVGGVVGILGGTAVCDRLSGKTLQQAFAGFVLVMMAVVLAQNFA